jgi:multiple sugar transport system substrate-binding protein
MAFATHHDRYAPYRGQTVVMSIPDHPHYDAMQLLLPEFTRETGIRVELARERMLRLRPLQLAELGKPQGHFDLICYVVMWKGEYVSKNLLHPLAGFLDNPQLADPAFDLADIVPGYLQNLGLVGGPKGYLPGLGAKLYGLPYGAETSILAYRRDVFEKWDLKPPKTYSELQALLPLLKSKTGMGALTSRGQMGHQCVHAWLLHLNRLGGKVFDAQWNPTFQRSAGIRALQLLRDIVETGPDGIPGFGQAEMTRSFLQGDSVMYLDSTVVFGQVRSPDKSRVDGKVSYVLHPHGASTSSQSGGLGLAIPRNAANANAAFLLMQWLTSKAQDKAVARLGGVPNRVSTISDVDQVRQYPEYITLKEQLRYSDPDWRPIIPPWDDINTGPLGAAVFQALNGSKPPVQALNDIVPRVSEIMHAAGYPTKV